WIQRTSASQTSASAGGGIVFGYGSHGYQFGLLNNGVLFLSEPDVAAVSSAAQVTDLNWHHVGVSKTGGTVVFYVDGTAYPAAAFNQVFAFTTSAAIGLLADRSSDTFQGLIDEVDVYNRALGATEVQAIYSAGSAGKCVSAPPAITTQPANVAGVAGQNATFSVVAAGTPPFAYQWQFNGVNVSGATASALTLINLQPANAGNYSVTVANGSGSVTSANAALTVHIQPSITTQPASQTAALGNTASFSVVAAGDAPLTYQWQFNNVNISGATTTSLTVNNVQLASEGSYSVTVGNPYGTITSLNASLSVNLAGCTPSASGLVSWWPGNGNASDLTGGNKGTVQGTVTYGAGEVGQAFSLNGVAGGGVVVGNPANLQLQNFTI